MQPRIYVYKITFQEVPFYYIGVHKEKTFNEEYMGSPVTHKEKWQIYTPQKEILSEFDYTDDGWLQAQDFEKELIRPVYNTDINCLNESCGLRISLVVCKAAARKANANRTPEQRSAASKKGRANMTQEQRSECSRKGRMKHLENTSPEQRSAITRKGRANMTQEQRSAITRKANASRTPEQRSAAARKANASKTPEKRSEAARKAGETKFQCTVTGHISNAGGLVHYQRARGIDTTNRVKIIPSLATS